MDKKSQGLKWVKNKKLLAVIVVSILLAGVSLFLLLKDNIKSNTPKEEPLITYSTDTPDESKPSADNYNWRGSADEPKKIRINKLSVDAYIQKAGVDQNKKVAVPNNVHLAGWFADSVKPGQNGLSIVAGHVSGRGTDGVFKKLDSLQNGDEFEVELGNGDIKKYRVINTRQVKETESAQYLFNQDPKVLSQLNLITCGGNFNSSNNQYDDRVIISAELI